jgi:predicted RNase H-like HicB family nuclease
MRNISVEIIKDEEYGGYTARIADVPAYGEGETIDAAISDLKEAMLVYIETYGLDDFMSRVVSPIEIRQMNLQDLAII